MSKFLINIEDIIFAAAKELFYEKGYDQVNMKEIASRADMAVGTLYNYFSNKNELYFSVLEKSWQETFEKIDILLNQNIDEKRKLKSSINLMYEEILDRKCMGMQIRKSKDLKDEESLIVFEKKIIKGIKKIFKNIEIKKQFKNDKNILEKIIYMLLINITMLIEYYSEYKEENIDYLYNAVVGFLE